MPKALREDLKQASSLLHSRDSQIAVERLAMFGHEVDEEESNV
jgi:hypothetical protein